MIIGGLQTGNTRWLAGHLQNAADNEIIEHVETIGTIATDIDGALAEFDAIASGTRATEGVYAAFINPPEPLSRRQYAQALAHIESRLGLTGQPRIVVFHVKDGREHCHVVWSRINAREMKAVHLSHDRQKLRRCAQELAARFGTELPPNLAQDRGAERFESPPQPTRAEKAMEAASGLSRDDRRHVITECYRNSDLAQGFANALEAAGYMLARGDKRVFVVVDIAGDVHSLARQIDGAKTKDVKKKLEGLTLSLLPPVERAKAMMVQRAAAQQDAKRTTEEKVAAARAERERLNAVQRKRRAVLDVLWQRMKIRHMHERKVLLAHIKAEREHRIARRHFRAIGLAIYLKKIAVIRQLIDYYLKRRKKKMDEQHRVLIEALKRRHDNEVAELRRRYAALDRLERREFTSFQQKFGDPGGLRIRRYAQTGDAAERVHAAFGRDWEPPAITKADVTRAGEKIAARAQEQARPVELAQREISGNIFERMNAKADMFDADFGSISRDALWTQFRENALDITQPVAANVTFTDQREASHPKTPPSWPGAP
ncbi:MAG: relaxase/mobilization nuclease domain-containing protein [Propylenella sp.]